MDVEGVAELLDRRVDLLRVRLFARLLAGAGPQAVDTGVPRQLSDPGPDRGVVPERVEPLERPGEHVLEHVLRVVLG